MWIKKKEIEQLSEFVKGYSSGEEPDIRENKEGSFNILKNDIYALVNTKNEQIKAVEAERDSLSDYMADISHQLKTPITSMMIMADLLEEAEPEKQTEFIHNIQVSLNKMEWLGNVCVYDMLSMMLRARSFDASDYKVGQKIKFPMADGGKVEEQTLIYRGKKNFKMEESKTKYRCLVFSFVEYEDGKEKEVVTFYITDDKNHLPVRLDMYLRFGSAKAFLTEAKGVRNPQTAIIK